MKRIWDVVVGSTVLLLALVFHLMILFPLAVCVGLLSVVPPQVGLPAALVLVVVLYDVPTCVDYHRRKRSPVPDSPLTWCAMVLTLVWEQFFGLLGASPAVFLLPRGFDRIASGEEMPR